MKAKPQQHILAFNNLGIGDIQLGKKPAQIAGMRPFSTFREKAKFLVFPHAARYYVFSGSLKGTIESRDPGIDIRWLFVSTNEDGFINRIFLYPGLVNEHIAGRLSQLYGEPHAGTGRIAGKLIGTHHFWITDSETEVVFFSPSERAETATVLSFRFFHDQAALKNYTIENW